MRYEIAVRSQHAKNGARGRGPDHYVAVLEIPDGVEVPKCLNRHVLSVRGIKFYYIGEAYARFSGPRSRMGKLLAEAKEFIQSKEKEIK